MDRAKFTPPRTPSGAVAQPIAAAGFFSGNGPAPPAQPCWIAALPPPVFPTPPRVADAPDPPSLFNSRAPSSADMPLIPPQLQPGIHERPRCRYFAANRCHYGVYCRFSHSLDS